MEQHYRSEALKEWDQARRKAFWSQMLAGLQRKNIGLLDFHDLSRRLHLENTVYKGVQTIPVDQIAGSEDRYEDFTRAFLPLNEDLRARWSNVATAYLDPTSSGVPPIEVYKVGQVYFVKDGNHRVSVAHQLGIEQIEAYVWEFNMPGGLSTDTNYHTLLLEAERQDFLTQTRLDDLRPDHGIRLTKPGGYIDMLRQISHYQDVLHEIDQAPISYEEAVTAWYDMLYETTVQIITESGILEQFPDRTAADLFVWITRRRHALQKRYGHLVKIKDTVQQVSKQARYPWPVRAGRTLWRWLRAHLS